MVYMLCQKVIVYVICFQSSVELGVIVIVAWAPRGCHGVGGGMAPVCAGGGHRLGAHRWAADARAAHLAGARPLR